MPPKPNKCLFCDEIFCYSLLTVLHVDLITSQELLIVMSGCFWSDYPHSTSQWKHMLRINPSDQFTSGGMTYILLSFLLQWHRKIPTITDTITHKAKALIRWILAREEHKPSRWLWSRCARLHCCQGNGRQLSPHPSLKTAFHTVSWKEKKTCQLLKRRGQNSSEEIDARSMHWELRMKNNKQNCPFINLFNQSVSIINITGY